jgi:hypothetical protein
MGMRPTISNDWVVPILSSQVAFELIRPARMCVIRNIYTYGGFLTWRYPQIIHLDWDFPL